MTPVSGTVRRIVFGDAVDRILAGVRHPEGRSRHRGLAALSIAPAPGSATHAIARHVRAGDRPRVLVLLASSGARLPDLREPGACGALGIDPDTPSVPWQPGAAGLLETGGRAAKAHGMVYAARSDRDRWQAVLFRWTAANAARVGRAAPAIPLPAKPIPAVFSPR